MKHNLIYFFTFIIISLTPINVQGQSHSDNTLYVTPWHKMEGGQVRIALENTMHTKHYHGYIEIDLKKGWKTYWQNPGNSGMAPFFSFDQKIYYKIDYPTPQLFQDQNDWSIGYKGHVFLPFMIETDQDFDTIYGSVTVGICEDICLPFTIDFDFTSQNNDNDIIGNDTLLMAQNALPNQVGEAVKIEAIKKHKTLDLIISNIGNTLNRHDILTDLFLDGGDMQLGPVSILKKQGDKYIAQADITFDPEIFDTTITYIAKTKTSAFTGNFHIFDNKK
ncbi:protein-disulfide reductase DsbD domain-containing protein [Bartonella tamiae]|uniref:Thiol:disulfide interchange protein DsbD N-terminal domain-containing protein n=1 Tax=Bartonella tamiae Th239 TaxID=1094558 RepID=J0QWY0_9HYPH|nr:protein-disulfide reductase DsbD domain-containing protein [Bartonella tamiae]EJF90541.1 hypothetical protein ME5_00942 [Bartonella tamiae Th239]EJF94081.1 hypothetical protein MEG_00939 [Bartonella tamiae Th307]